MKDFNRIKLFFIFLTTFYIALCASKVSILTNDNEFEVLGFNQYKAYEFEWSPKNKENNTHLFSYTVQSNNTLSVYIFNKEQYNQWNKIMVSLNDTQISQHSKDNSSSIVTIENVLKEKHSIHHLKRFDCPTKSKICHKEHCKIEEDIFYMVIFGYGNNDHTYSLFDVEGDFKLKSIELNGKSAPTTLLNYGIAYKTSFIGMTENDNETGEANPEEEADIYKKMMFIAIIIIPSIIIFLLIMFVYCHRGSKIKRESKEELYNPKEENNTMTFRSPYMGEMDVKGKKPYYQNYDNSTTLRNDDSKLSMLNSYSYSKGASTIYNNISMDQESTTNSTSSYPYIEEMDVPFKNKSTTKRLDLTYPYTRKDSTISKQANINIPYNMNHYNDGYRMSYERTKSTYGPSSRDIMIEEHSEDIVNSSLGHVEGEEFDNSKNIYIKINRSTNKYNTEEFLKEDSINKIKEKHSCITQLSKLFNNSHGIVNDSSSSSSGSMGSSSPSPSPSSSSSSPSISSSSNDKNGKVKLGNHSRCNPHLHSPLHKKIQDTERSPLSAFQMKLDTSSSMNSSPKNFNSYHHHGHSHNLRKDRNRLPNDRDDDGNSNSNTNSNSSTHSNSNSSSIPSFEDEELKELEELEALEALEELKEIKAEEEALSLYNEEYFLSEFTLPSPAKSKLNEKIYYKNSKCNTSTHTFGNSVNISYTNSEANSPSSYYSKSSSPNYKEMMMMTTTTDPTTDIAADTTFVTTTNTDTTSPVNINSSTQGKTNKTKVQTKKHSLPPYISHHPLPHLPSTSTQESNTNKYVSSSNIIGRLIYTFYYSSSRILNVDDVVKIKKIFDNNWVKVERNPNEFFIIPLLVLDAPFEEIRMFKKRSQAHRVKMSKEEMQVNERVEPSPEYLYHCAYISFKDYQKMSLNSKWERKIKTLNHSPPEKTNINSNININNITTSFSHKMNYPIYSHQHKTIPVVDLEPFMEHDSTHYYTYNNNTTLKNPPSQLIEHSTKKDFVDPINNPLYDSSLEGMTMVGSSQDDIIINDHSHSRILGSEEEEDDDDINANEKEAYYHFKNISDPGMTAITTLESFAKLENSRKDKEKKKEGKKDTLNEEDNKGNGIDDDDEDIHLTTFAKSCRYSTLKSQRTLVDENYEYNNDDDNDEVEKDEGPILDINQRKNFNEKPYLLLKPISQIRNEDSQSTIAVNKLMEPIFNADYPEKNHIDIRKINSNAFGHVIDGQTNLIINDRRANVESLVINIENA